MFVIDGVAVPVVTKFGPIMELPPLSSWKVRNGYGVVDERSMTPSRPVIHRYRLVVWVVQLDAYVSLWTIDSAVVDEYFANVGLRQLSYRPSPGRGWERKECSQSRAWD